MAIWLFTGLLLAFAYTVLIRYIQKTWKAIPENFHDQISEKFHHISVLIAARNEQSKIKNCIESILDNTYPADKFEIIVVNDHSTDDTSAIVQQYHHRNVRLVHQKVGVTGKKAAITLGVEVVTGEIIAATDADSIVPEQWLHHINQAFQQPKIQIQTGPVMPEQEDTLLNRFQCLDFAATAGITGFGIFSRQIPLANGANMAYRKAFFNEAGGYHHDSHIASGDDIFLMQKAFNRNPDGLVYLKSPEALVITHAENDWRNFISQRRRWAGKTKNYTDHRLTMLQSFVFVFCAATVAFSGAGIFLDFRYLLLAGIMLSFKYYSDYNYLKEITKYYGYQGSMKFFVISFLLYIGHILLSGWFVFFPGQTYWKGRKIEN